MAAKSVTAKAVSEWFINNVDRDSGDSITHLKLQKLLYYAQAWHLANKGQPLFDDDFQAWAHGPVIRSIYDRFKELRWDVIPKVKNVEKLPTKVERYLTKVLDMYGKYSAKHLERLTHSESPWKDVRGFLSPEERCESVISKESIKAYYGGRIGKSWG